VTGPTPVDRLTVDELLARAAVGDETAWTGLVTRYTPLVAVVTRRLGLDAADAADVNQTVWLRLVEYLDRLREPAALPGWIVATARHEGLRVLRTSRTTRPYDPFDPVGAARIESAALTDAGGVSVDDELLRAERRQVLRDAFTQLPERCQRLLRLMLREPPVSYQEIGRRLDVPVGSVGPTRARCLDKLRRSPVVTGFLRGTARADAARAEVRGAGVGRSGVGRSGDGKFGDGKFGDGAGRGDRDGTAAVGR
jgi:RNA polymerase sigma factor (sigma-70 family)